MASSENGGNGHAGNAVTFEYIKSEFFRVIHVDGAIGSITPRGLIHASFFSERPAIPRKLVFQVNQDGSLGEEIPSERVTREGYIREMDVDVLMTIDVAQSLVDWLTRKIAEARQQITEQKK